MDLREKAWEKSKGAKLWSDYIVREKDVFSMKDNNKQYNDFFLRSGTRQE